MSIYCTYITFYRGNKLPPFYIGSTSVERINSGYRGSVRSKEYKEIWELEIKENPHLFSTKILNRFNERKLARDKEDKLHRQLDVVKNPLYTNKAFASGCFGATMIGRKHSEETKRKISLKSKLKKTKKRSEESKIKMSNSAKAKWASGTRKYCGKTGKTNPMFGKTPANATPCIYNGIQFPSIAAKNRYIKGTH